ncbi:putative phosphoglycerate mutase [Lewinella marina]|uniref:Histidine phosphatase family protein n=1 Tax=Neolewinella marina TaxID=438751 RepID=A0A2G0CKC2_9BACT|nr:histidine phosphatase family protein [Neolewinella marina]NJB84393.1 putative phosphoglycerate mutase [Neolewinella marina]PHL00412.1 histidine phosphatase family protein [Neolewinella marina]
MTNRKLIYLVRHGETDYNLRGIVQGSGVDSSLNETGRQQAAHFHERYRDEPFELVITSGLKRTWETVAPFIEGGLSWEKHETINEMCWGSHEGKLGTPESIAEYQAIKNGWGAGQLDGRIGGGESARELGDRLQQFIHHLEERSESRILVCSHGRAMCALVTLMMGRPLERMNELRHNNLGLWVAERQGPGRYDFLRQNDRDHLPAPLNVERW